MKTYYMIGFNLYGLFDGVVTLKLEGDELYSSFVDAREEGYDISIEEVDGAPHHHNTAMCSYFFFGDSEEANRTYSILKQYADSIQMRLFHQVE